ncbi:hypothetical protein HPB50_004640 [Hyalomma asiaticum]|uniref:Uncharacterized protein n=1 Tax=Hyalomma asiaticum TaxID=266040 RepID=A0ACB7SBR5_HYAAI|nr:hypothetical protein HPB50_004640 [Hyalomma asiaticum]
MSTQAPGNPSSTAVCASDGATDIYAVEKCVEMYDLALTHTASAIGALLNNFERAFLSSTELLPQLTADKADPRERSQFLDVGCGSGGFTKKYLLPHLPHWCQRLVAVDNSEAMLKFATERRPDPRIHYRKLDIVANEGVAQFIQAEGRFQRVYSFLAFHWIVDHRTALKNVETLLAPGGECFIIFSNSLDVFDVFAAMMESPRWKKYSDLLLEEEKVELRKLTGDIVKEIWKRRAAKPGKAHDLLVLHAQKRLVYGS